jgi:hypothetical protein
MQVMQNSWFIYGVNGKMSVELKRKSWYIFKVWYCLARGWSRGRIKTTDWNLLQANWYLRPE